MQQRIITCPNMRANWYYLLQEAKLNTGFEIDESLENYLILTLNNLNPDTHNFSDSVSIKYMNAISNNDEQRWQKLRDVGDQCLLINGMFPEISIKRNVTLNYYAVIGRQAYKTLANQPENKVHLDKDLFNNLSTHFVGLSDLMHIMFKPKYKSNSKLGLI
jgi:hypothetical protein